LPRTCKSPIAHRREWSLREPRSFLRNQAGGATIAFLESDRRDLPGADQRNGDI